MSAANPQAIAEAITGRGWMPVPLHGMTPDGRCACGNPDGQPDHDRKQGGKHPIAGAWQQRDWRGWPGWANHAAGGGNVGIVTGRISGFWVLDWDPGAVGADPTPLGRLVGERIEPHVKTGGGGNHWRFAMPADFPVTNRRGQLPAGWDVRGDGGQVVAPPSVSGKGPYVELREGVDVAPDWLLDLIRPAPEPAREVPAVPVLPVGADRAQRVAWAGLANECETYAALTDGRRGDSACAFFRSAHELMNTGRLPEDQVYARVLDAVARARQNGAGGYADSEMPAQWERARAAVSGRVRDIGPDPLAAEGLSGDLSGFISQAGAGTAPAAVQPTTDPVDALLAEMLTAEQLRALPPPQPLVNGLLDLETTAWLIGKPKSYKSFVALDIAAHVARGLPWHGRAVRQGPVVYVVAEGARGVRLRVDAWERTYGPMGGVRFLPRPVQAKDRAAWAVLVEACRRLTPVLVVIDTQARVTVGMEENSNTEMGVYVDAADAIKRATGACVLTVHHIGRNGSDARGASALDGAQDCELRCDRTGDLQVSLVNDEQKDLAEAEPIALTLVRVDGGTDPGTGRDLSSLVISAATMPALGDAPVVEVGPARARALYGAILDLFNRGDGGTRAEIRAAFFDTDVMASVKAKTATGRKAWSRAWSELIERKLIAKAHRGDRFKVIVMPRVGPEGVLTRNAGEHETDPPGGWELWTADEDARFEGK